MSFPFENRKAYQVALKWISRSEQITEAIKQLEETCRTLSGLIKSLESR